MSDLTLLQNLSPPQFALNIFLNGVPPYPDIESVYADVYLKFEGEADESARLIGSQTVGGTLQVPYNPGDKPITLFAVARTEKAEQSVQFMRNAEKAVFAPNLETLVPTIFESKAATNTELFVRVQNYTANSRYRQIQISANADFSGATIREQGVVNEPNAMLDPDIIIPRSTNLSIAETRYIRVRHSSNAQIWTEWSNEANNGNGLSYPNSGGTGGTTGGTPPPTGGTDPIEPTSCFAGKTVTYIHNEQTGIEEIRFLDLYRRQLVGKKTISFNEDNEECEGEILRIERTVARAWLYVEFSDGEMFEVKHDHPFFTDSGYVEIGDLSVGASVINADGSTSTITFKQERKGTMEFFNMQVAETENYVVGVTKKRVHNKRFEPIML